MSSRAAAPCASAPSSTTSGKPATRSRHGDYVTFIGHDREGARIVGELCERLKASRRLHAHLQGLTIHHLRLGFLVRERPLPRRRMYEYLRDTDPVGADVTLLSVADRLAARGRGRSRDRRWSRPTSSSHARCSPRRSTGAATARRGRRSPATSSPRELGIEPGPELGRIIGEVEAAVYARRGQEPRRRGRLSPAG